MNLNIEHGSIELPHTPVVRYSTPIVDNNGVTQGIIVLNLFANELLKLTNSNAVINKAFFII